jgi:hypothetical protein
MQATLPRPTQENVRWLLGLRGLAHAWVESDRIRNAAVHTGAYVDLTFAFALARVGALAESGGFWRQASEQLTGLDAAHLLLRQMFGYRIAQVREGEEHRGPLPNDILSELENTERLLRYVVDRRRKHSQILEPDQRFNPYRHWGARISDFERALAELSDLADADELTHRVDELLLAVPKGGRGNQQRARVLRAGLEAAPRVGEDFARKMLDQTVGAYDALPEAKEMGAHLEQAAFLEKALFVVGRFRLLDYVGSLLDRVRGRLSLLDVGGVYTLSLLVRESIRVLVLLRLGDELDSFLGEVAGLVLQGRTVEQVGEEGGDLYRLLVLLGLAEGWYGFGWDRLAEPVLDRVWSILVRGTLPPREQTGFACAYIAAAGQAPGEAARCRLEEVFRQLKGIKDTYTTSSHFSVSQLDVVESVALAAVEVCRRGG